MREKVGKSRNTVFPMICGSGGSKSRLAKAAGAEPAGQMRDEKIVRRCGAKHISKSKCAKHSSFGPLLGVALSKKCTQLWGEAHVEVKMHKTHQLRTTFGSCDVEKVHAVVARSTFRSQKHHMLGPLFDVQMSFRVAGARDCAPYQKWAKREGFVAFPKTMGGVGHLKRICKEAFSVEGAIQETCSPELLGGPGADFLRGVAFWEHQVFSFGKMILCDRCSTSYGLTFSWQAQYFRQVEWENRKTHWYEAVSSALNFPFMKEVSQNCFVFYVVSFENWGSLAELLRFWCGQLEKLRKSRRIASLLTLSSSVVEVSQNCCVFKLADR